MPIGLRINNELFHGTSVPRAKNIIEKGFEIGGPKCDRWLGPQGIYFVPNRPLIAIRFALIAASEEAAAPALLKARLSTVEDSAILDLTSDVGLHLLYVGYAALERAFKSEKHKESPRTPDSYFIDLETKKSQVDKFSREILYEYMPIKSSCNWDSAALRYIAATNNCNVVVAAIQEGTSFSRSFYGYDYYNKVSNYKGIGYRDHIEVCVLDQAILIPDMIEMVAIEEIKSDFEEPFISAILDFRNPDS